MLHKSPFAVQTQQLTHVRCEARLREGEEAGCDAGLPRDELPTVVVPITVMTEMEPKPAAVMIPLAVLDVEKPVAIAFLCLCRTLEAGESHQAETRSRLRAQELVHRLQI